MSKFSFKITTFILLLTLTLLLTISTALAQGEANVTLQPVESTGDTLTVDVMVNNVSNMYGAEFRLKYDPAVLAVQDLNADQNGVQIQGGTFLPVEKGFVVANKVDEVAGEIVFAMTLLNPAPPVDGGGPLARVSFKVLQNSPSTITVEHAKLVAADLQTIPSQTGSLNVGESAAGTQQQPDSNAPAVSVDTPPAAGESSFPWWIIAILVMVLGVLALGGLIMLGGKSKTTSQKATPVRQPRRPQSTRQSEGQQQPAGSRPSAFRQQQNIQPNNKPHPPR